MSPKNIIKTAALVSAVAISTACSTNTMTKVMIAKTEISIAKLPSEVIAIAKRARPDLVFNSADTEVRHGIRYFDIEGTNTRGEEIELDMMQSGDSWKIVEIQRDIKFMNLPMKVKDIHAQNNLPKLIRIIESDQDNGTIIYELFDANDTKYEIKYTNNTATLLTSEWIH